ncbi:MAG: ABC transporter permease subunit [Arachnia sp.]
MNAAVLRRGLANGWRGLLITAAVVAGMLAVGLVVYADLDLSIYDRLPDAVRSLMGLPSHADPAIMAYNEMLAAVGALAFVGVAVAIGAQAVAGEEQDRTLHLVLAAPVSRVTYVLSRAAAMVALLVGGGALLWAVAELAPLVVGTEVGDADLFALVAHLTACAVFHAALALSVGALTGRKGVAAGLAAGVMVLGWLGAGLLPLWREGAADWIPWTWFNGTKPLVNGVDGGHLALLLGGAAALIAVGALGFQARELRLAQAGSSLSARLAALRRLPGARIRRNSDRGPAPRHATASLDGRRPSLLGLRLAAQRVLLAYVVVIMGLLMGLSMPLIYEELSAAIGGFATSFPQTMTDLFGGGDLTTPAGFLHLESFGMMLPAAVILVATVAASSGIAGEERARRMSLLLAQPISRTRVYATIAATSALYVLVVTSTLFFGTWAGIVIAGLDVALANLAWACVLATLLGWFHGALALLLSAATGRSSVAVWGTAGVALVGYFGYTLLLAAGHEAWGWWSPLRAYLHGTPMEVGVAWWQPVWLGLGTILLLAAGLPLFRARDLRIGS